MNEQMSSAPVVFSSLSICPFLASWMAVAAVAEATMEWEVEAEAVRLA